MQYEQPSAESSVQYRLLQATEQLIYRGGITATGMDAIVKASGVARKSIYQHFGNKEALVAAALTQRDEHWMQWFIAATSQHDDPVMRIESIFAALSEWFSSDHFHGCAFINAAGEIHQINSPIRAVSKAHKIRLLDYIQQLVKACHVAQPVEVARQVLLLVDGAISVALVTNDVTITDSAAQMAKLLLMRA